MPLADAERQLEEVFRLVSNIRVSGDDVERMASAKALLRAVWNGLKTSPDAPDGTEAPS